MGQRQGSGEVRGFEIALLVTLACCWASSYTFIKIGVETIPPLTAIALRTAIAAAILFLLMRLRGIRLPRDAVIWRHFAIQAFLSSAIPFTLVAWAEQTVDASLATILNSTTPIFAFLLTWSVTRHEPVTGRKLFGVVIGLAGICLIIGLDALDGLGRDVMAQMAIVLSSFFYGAAVIFGRRFDGLDPMATATGSLVCGVMILIPVSVAIDAPWTIRPSLDSALAILALAIVSTALGLVIYFRLLRTLGSVGTTAQAYLRAPIGVGIGMVMLGEELGPTAAIGLVCIIVGVAAMTIPARSRASETRTPAPARAD